MSLFLSPTGRPLPLDEWVEQFGDGMQFGFHRIGLHDWPTKKRSLVSVSTVWLGMDHSFGYGPPVIFETMVFAKPSGWSELYVERYSTIEDAVAGHWTWVKRARREWPAWYLKGLRNRRFR